VRCTINYALYHTLQIVIEATVGTGFLGDISIDDLSLTQGPCASE